MPFLLFYINLQHNFKFFKTIQRLCFNSWVYKIFMAFFWYLQLQYTNKFEFVKPYTDIILYSKAAASSECTEIYVLIACWLALFSAKHKTFQSATMMKNLFKNKYILYFSWLIECQRRRSAKALVNIRTPKFKQHQYAENCVAVHVVLMPQSVI